MEQLKTASIYSIQGSTGLDKDIPIYVDNSTFKYLVRHEFGHSFVNHITKDNINEVYSYYRLLAPIREKMAQQSYSNWEVALNEHIVRAVEIRLTELNDSKEDADKLINMEREKGFIYIDNLVNLLKNEYEPNKNEYKTFENFYPRILDELNTLKKK